MLLLILSCAELNFDNDFAIDNDGDGFSVFDGDCDDTNPDKNPEDKDGDGLSSCQDDCDDNDTSLNRIDLDQDGVTSCDGDCRDDDPRFQIDNCPVFAQIESGSFFMGSPEDEVGRNDDELVHQVQLSHDFEIMTTEVTQSLFHILTNTRPAHFSSCGASCPIENINWSMSAYAANLMSDLEGYEQCYNCEGSTPPTCRPKGNHCTLVNRMVQENIVIDQESVVGLGDDVTHAIAIYHTNNDAICEVHFY